jgi:diadenosine tetraphosphate (Ap4A) HIT family hydrolase
VCSSDLWLLLVPRVNGATEWIDLDGNQQRLLLAEINQISKLLRGEPSVLKLNIGALGNVVRQLHVHIVGRCEGDAAWPGPVWGCGVAQQYEADELSARVAWWRSKL